MAPAGQDDGTALVAGGSGWVGGWLDVGPGLDVAAGLAALAAWPARPRGGGRRGGAAGGGARAAASQPGSLRCIRAYAASRWLLRARAAGCCYGTSTGSLP